MASTASAEPRPVGGELVALAVATILATLACVWFPPSFSWRWWLMGTAVAAGAVGLWRGRRGWWVACGVLAGAAAASWAVLDPPLAQSGRLAVRFEATVRDGWRPAAFGWQTRVRLHGVTADERRVRHPREVLLTVGGEVAREGLPPPGSRISGLGELLRREGAALRRPLLNVKSALLIREVQPPRGVNAWREAGVAQLYRAAGVNPDRIRAAGLVAALVLGRREGLLEGEVGALRAAGLAHLLAVSGLHVGLVAGVAWICLRLLGVRPRAARWVVMGVVGAFALGAGMAPPVRRAATGALAYLLARQLGRPLEALPTVWGVVALLSLLEPQVLVEPGFQLSAGVTLALVRWVTPMAARLPLPRGLAVAVAVPVVAQAAAFPIVGAHFGTASPFAVLSNLVAAPLAAVLVAGGLAALLTAFVWPPLATTLLGGVGLLQLLLARLAGLTEGVAYPVPPFPLWLALGLLGLGLAALARWRLAAAAGLVGVVGMLVWLVLPGGGPAGAAEVRLLPVREGMAMLLRCGKSAVLVDTGRHPLEAARALSALRLRRLDGLVLTHADDDHVGGAEGVLRRVGVRELILPLPAEHDVAKLAPLVRLIRSRGGRERWVAGGQQLLLGEIPLQVVWPPSGTTLRGNEASLVLRVTVAGATLLVTGDIERLAEARLVAARAPVRAQVLQVPHHGSRTSSTADFLAAVAPRVAVVPTGVRPRWSYPSPEVASRLRALPALLLAHRHGFDRLWWDGGSAAWVGAPQPVRVHLAQRDSP